MMDTTGKARATCYARYEDEVFYEGLNASTTLQVVLSHARKNHVCASVKCACLSERVLCGVYTSRRLKRNRHCL